MAAAVHAAPHHLDGVGQQSNAIQYGQQAYQNGLGPINGADGAEETDAHPAEEDMETYYADHEYHQQLHHQQMLVQQAGMAYQSPEHDEDEDDDDDDDEHGDMYSDDSSEESVLPDENIDFGLIYALHTFLATVEGQASVVKGDSLLLLDDANSYWWLVRVLKTEDVGYIPAENIETPYERLARLNKHRNIDVAAPTAVDSAAVNDPSKQRDGKLKSLMGWGRRGSTGATGPMPPPNADGEELEEREGRRVYFAPPTYVEHPGVTWSDDGEDDDEDDDREDDMHEGDVEQQQQQDEEGKRRATLMEDVDHILDMEADMQDPHFADYDAEPDDGVEWAQDAVQAQREEAAGAGAAGVVAADGPQGETSHSTGLVAGAAGAAVAAAAVGAGAAAAASNSTSNADAASQPIVDGPSQRSIDVPSQPTTTTGIAPSAANNLAAIAGVSPPDSPSKLAPPDRSPSPKAPAGLAARANPTPPPSRAPPPPITTTEASPEPDARHGMAAAAKTTPPRNANPLQRLKTAAAPTPSTPADQRSSIRSSASSYGLATSPRSPSTPASPAAPGAPRAFRPPQWYSDAFDIRSFNALVRARALDIKRNTPVPRPKPAFADDVQDVFYGTKLDFETLQPDLRAPYVHVQAKMDAFDRDIDALLGSLVAVK